MKVLIVARGYPSKKYKMNGIFEFDQAKSLIKAGEDVIYAAIDVRSIRRWRKWGIEKKYIDGVKVYAINVPCGRVHKKISNKVKVWALTRLYNIIRKEQGEPDIIHSHFIGTGYTVAQVFYHKKIPLILTEHYSGMNQESLNSYFKDIGKFTYSRMDQILAVSDFLASNIQKNFNVNVSTVPNIIDLSSFNFSENQIPTTSKQFSFISVGRLHPDKRMDVLIKAFYKAFKDNNDVILNIFGEGQQKSHLKNMISNLGLHNKVYLRGLVDRKTIAEEMIKSDCFVLASRLETFGLSYIEALSMGLPVISTKCGGPESFIDESNGVLVNVDDTDNLAEELLNMYNQVYHYKREKISKKTINRFNEQRITEIITDIYHKLK